MPKPPASWKAFENRIAKYIGGKRRGAYVSDGTKGKSDIILKGFSIECKLLKQAGWQKFVDACKQAESNRESDLEIPIAIIKKNSRGIPDKDSIVAIRLEIFKEHFL